MASNGALLNNAGQTGSLGMILGVVALLLLLAIVVGWRWRHRRQSIEPALLRAAQEALRRERLFLRRMTETSPVAIVTANPDGAISFANRRAEKLLGLSTKEISQRFYNSPQWQIRSFGGESVRDEELPFRRVMDTGKPIFDARHAIEWPDGRRRFLSINGAPLLNDAGGIDGVIFAIEDITERTQAEKSLNRLNRELRAVSDCREALIHANEEQALLREICGIVCEVAGYRMAWVGLADHDSSKMIRPVASAGAEDGYLGIAGITWSEDARGRGPTGTAIRTGKIAWIQDFSADPHAMPWRAEALQRGYRSSIALPLKNDKGDTFGALSIYSGEIHGFTAEERHLLEELSGDLAFGVNVLRARADLVRAEVELRTNEKRHRMAQAIGHVGNWEYNVQTTKFWGSDEAKRIYGFDPRQADFSTDEVEKCIPERERVHQALVDLIENRKPYNLEFEIIPINSSKPKTIASIADLERDENGAPKIVTGVIQDITERKKVENELRRLNDELERRVKERTAELERKNTELEKMNRLFVGRELAMVELKKRIRALESQVVGKPNREKTSD